MRLPMPLCFALFCAALTSVSAPARTWAAGPDELAMFRLAKSLLDQHRLEEAKIAFEKAISAYPNNALGQYYFAETLARSAKNTSDLERAERLYQSAYKAYPNEEMGRTALAEAEKLGKRRRAIEGEDSRRLAAAERVKATVRRQTEATELEQQRKGRLPEYLAQARKFYVLVKRRLTPEESTEPGRKEEMAYCIWFEEQGFEDEPDSGTTIRGLKIFARAADGGQRTVSWPASASWSADESTLQIRPTNPSKRLGIDISQSNGRIVARPANWPFPIAYGLRSIEEPCSGTVQ